MSGSKSVERRLDAARRFERGERQADVAAALGVSRTTALRWYRSWLRGGADALARTGQRGRPVKLGSHALSEALRDLPRDWPIDRICVELEKRTGVRYHPGHVGRVLRRWGWNVAPPSGPRLGLRDPDGVQLDIVTDGDPDSDAP